MMNDFVTWSSLKNSRLCKNKYTYHYKSISRIHHRWSKSGVYQDAYDEIILNNDNLFISTDVSINLFIDSKPDSKPDSTLIINKCGIEGIGYGGETKKKKFTKLTVVCNKNIQNVAVYPNNVITKITNKVTKNKIIKKELNIPKINKYLNDIFFDNIPINVEHINVKPINVKSINVKTINVKSINVKPINVKPINDKPINDKPINDKPINDKPINVKPINVKPINVKTINVKPINVKTINVKPINVKPINVKTINVKPINVKPINDKPINDKPINVKTINVKPINVKPINVKPINVKPINVKPINVKPINAMLIDKLNKDMIKVVKTLEHDVKGVKPIIKIIGKKDKPIKLIGDKGYLINSDDKKEIKKMNVDMIARLLRQPKRKNQKKRNTKEELICLKERYKIENMIAKIKVFNRVHVRRDKLLCTYMGFVYLAFLYLKNKLTYF